MHDARDLFHSPADMRIRQRHAALDVARRQRIEDMQMLGERLVAPLVDISG